MTKEISLSVNDVPIKLDYFVEGYIDHVVGGILAALKDTGEISTLELEINNEGQVAISLNECDVPLNYFANEIIRGTILGMVATLKGVDAVNRLKLTLRR